MCGILCEICSSSGSRIINDEKILRIINNRGPDCTHNVDLNVANNVKVTFYGSVLWMQGSGVTRQPVENEHGVLLYNGDIFDETWNTNENDTTLIMDKLTNCSNNFSEQQMIQVLKSLKGPFSIIYYNKSTHNLLFTRDRIGRNTLLFHKNEDSIVISSVLNRKYKCAEVPASNIYILNLDTNKIRLYSWENSATDYVTFTIDSWLRSVQEKQNLPDEEFTFDCDEYLEINEEDGVINYIENTALDTKCKHILLRKIMEHSVIKDIVVKISKLLEKSIKIRLETQPNKCKDCLLRDITCSHCSVGVLFSGGLDCTILAFMADKYIPKQQSIELINVAFKKDENATYEVPDRMTGRKSFEELKKLCPARKWVFKEINVPKEELEALKKSTIADLVYPRQTILDESLGSALWFAARGQDNDSTSSCRVLLLGSGADELFGGYTRHRNAFKRHGWLGLHKELQLDWRRISFRNLARDNRVICDHGRQPRMPYLDEDLADFVLKLKPWLKCFPSESLGQGVGDKLILRLVALNLGLSEVVTFPKRALQFGSRIANKKEKGSDLSKSFIDFEIND